MILQLPLRDEMKLGIWIWGLLAVLFSPSPLLFFYVHNPGYGYFLRQKPGEHFYFDCGYDAANGIFSQYAV